MRPGNLRATRELLAKLPTQQQLLVVYHISGAISTNIVRSKYDTEFEDQKCTFCMQRDTVEHRLFECPVSQSIRDGTADWEQFATFERAMLHCPLMPYHEDEPFHRACCHLREIDLQIVPNDDLLLVYTDGSMDSMHDGVTCAAFSVITLHGFNDITLRQWTDDFRKHGQVPPFEVAYSAKVPGRQTINRAEFLAIVKAITLSTNIEIITDSSYSRDLILQVLDHPVPEAYVQCPNYDLIFQLITLLRSGPARHIVIKKTHSHQPITDDLDDRLLLDRLGNSLADEVANLQRTHDTLGFVDLHESIRQHFRQWSAVLLKFFQFIIETAITFQDAWKAVRVKEPSATVSDRLQQLSDVVQPPFKNLEHVVLTDSMKRLAYFTVQYTEALLNWAKQLQWSCEPVCGGAGVTYTELMLSFLRTSDVGIPVNMNAEISKTPKYALRHHSPQAAAMPQPRHQDVRIFAFSLEYLVKLTGAELFPVHSKGFVSSMTFVGVPKARSGYKIRCRYPFEQQVLAHIAASVSVDTGHWSLDHIGNVAGSPVPTRVIFPEDTACSMATVFSRYKYEMRGQHAGIRNGSDIVVVTTVGDLKSIQMVKGKEGVVLTGDVPPDRFVRISTYDEGAEGGSPFFLDLLAQAQ
eukprot:Skav226197  [mRNA]  locus=scaffold2208:94017:97105:- [translate_table: standard]